MPPKTQQAAKKRQRVHATNKSLEAQQFSTVRLPKGSEVPAQKVNVDALHAEARGQPSARQGADRATADSSHAAFDPIPTDAVLCVVENSQYWPPPTLAELQASTGVAVVGTDGFDAYDRRADDVAARREKTKIVKGELNHPRGKARQNTVVKISQSSSDGESDSDA